MAIRGRIAFWGDGVTCFCHEALGRLLHDHFAGVVVHAADLALEKFESVDRLELKESAWHEYLRNGPRHRFVTSGGITGILSRYEIALDEPIDSDGLKRVEAFLADLRPAKIVVDRDA